MRSTRLPRAPVFGGGSGHSGAGEQPMRILIVEDARRLRESLADGLHSAGYAVDSVALPDGRLRRTYTRRPGQPNAPVTRLTVLQRGPVTEEVAATIVQRNPLFSAQKQSTSNA